MTKLNQKERLAFIQIIDNDLTAINSRIHEQLNQYWEQARTEILHDCGFDELIKEKKQLNEEGKKIRQRIHEIEEIIEDKTMTVNQVLEYNGKINDWGKAEGANFLGIPLDSQIDYKIAKLIETNIDVHAPAKYVEQIAKSTLRELAMAGSFEEARVVYEDFYSLDFRKYGVDIPPRLKEIKKDRPTLEEKDRLALPQPERDEKIEVS